MTFVTENHHYSAWCQVCSWHGPLRFKRELAAGDAAVHVAEKHGDGSFVVTPHADDADPELWPHTARPAGAPDVDPADPRNEW